MTCLWDQEDQTRDGIRTASGCDADVRMAGVKVEWSGGGAGRWKRKRKKKIKRSWRVERSRVDREIELQGRSNEDHEWRLKRVKNEEGKNRQKKTPTHTDIKMP